MSENYQIEASEKRNQEVREASGNINYDDRLTDFLYHLMRDYLPVGVVEEIFRESMNFEDCTGTEFSNGWLAQYANNLSKELKK